MCFFFFCCCNCCNNYSSKCVEIFIFIFSFLSCILSIFLFFIINKEHITLICLILLISLIIFSVIILISIILILIWRFNETINTKHNKVSEAFTKVGLIITIFYFIVMVIIMRTFYSDYYDFNHPCTKYEINENNIKNKTNIKLTFEENKEEFCIENPDYKIQEVTIKEYIITYSITGVLLIFMLCLIYFWFNDYRRIKYLIDGPLTDFNAQEIKKEENNINYQEDSNEKRVNERINKKPDNNLNNKFLYNMYGKEEYGIRYDIYGKPIFKIRRVENDNKLSLKDNIKTTTNNARFSKRKSIQNFRVNRVSIYKGINKNSSERSSIKQLQYSRGQTTNSNAPRTKATTNSNLNIN